MKKHVCGILILLTLLSVSLSVCAERLPIIQDDADLLTDEEEQALYNDMLPVCEYGTPMFWSTTESGSYYTLAENFYHRQIGTDSGTLFVINMKARQLTVFSDGANYRVITNAEAETITDNVFRMAGRGDYYACAASVFDQVYRLLHGEQIARPMKLVSNVLLAAALALLIIYLYISRRYEQHGEKGKIRTAVPASVLSAAGFSAVIAGTQQRMTKQVKTDLSSHSGGHGGGGHGGGGFSGGGHSGGGGSHGF